MVEMRGERKEMENGGVGERRGKKASEKCKVKGVEIEIGGAERSGRVVERREGRAVE